jgi:hypothetical protein
MGDQTTWGDALPKLKLTQYSVVKRILSPSSRKNRNRSPSHLNTPAMYPEDTVYFFAQTDAFFVFLSSPTLPPKGWQ